MSIKPVPDCPMKEFIVAKWSGQSRCMFVRAISSVRFNWPGRTCIWRASLFVFFQVLALSFGCDNISKSFKPLQSLRVVLNV